MSDLPIEVYGIYLVVRLVADEEAAIQLQCPKGASILYGEIVSRGDGFDSEGNVFRAMPHIGTIPAAFEESSDEIRRALPSRSRVMRSVSSRSMTSWWLCRRDGGGGSPNHEPGFRRSPVGTTR
jgi:hypothetical protein